MENFEIFKNDEFLTNFYDKFWKTKIWKNFYEKLLLIQFKS